MGRRSQRAKIELSETEVGMLSRIAKSRSEELRKVQRAKILLMSFDGRTDTEIRKTVGVNVNTVRLTIDKCLAAGVVVALGDLARPGAPREIGIEDRAWVISIACDKPTEHGYAQETWTYTLLLSHIRENAAVAGHPVLSGLSRSSLWGILNKAEIKPDKVNYYLDRKDPEFEIKMEQVLAVYKEVSVRLEGKDSGGAGDGDAPGEDVIVSYDEKPGIQAIGRIAPDMPPVPGVYQGMGRDYEYKRYGTLSLLAGINLISGEITADVSDTHKSSDFTRFLDALDAKYATAGKIRVVLDNHSAHVSKETMNYLSGKPGRFEFVFTPKHGSWLNIIEGFFSKFTRVFLRGIRVGTKEELRERILRYIDEVNRNPTIIRWKYRMDDIIL